LIKYQGIFAIAINGMSYKKYNLPPRFPFLKATLNAFKFLNDPVIFLSNRLEQYGGTYCPSLTPKLKAIVTCDADFISYIIKENHRNYKKSDYFGKSSAEFFGNGLLFSNGDYWLKQRRLIQPAFHKEKLQGLYGVITTTIDNYLTAMPQGNAVDVYPLMHELTFNIVMNSLFDISLPQDKLKAIAKLFTEVQHFFIKDTSVPVRRILYPFTQQKRKFQKKAAELRSLFTAIIKERKQSGETKNDLLDMLLKSKYEDTGEGMTENQILDEALVLIFAGHETTANALAWMLYAVANNNTIQEKLKASITNNNVSESLQNDYIKAVINETMRLYPPAWIVERAAVNEDSFGAFTYPKEMLMIAFIYGLHRNKNFWLNAEQFYPERFIEQPDLAKSKYFYPFGAGPRMCIGNNFAMAEMCFFMQQFFKQYTLTATAQVPKKISLITLRPDEVRLCIKKIPIH
jgi:cytochrome P450